MDIVAGNPVRVLCAAGFVEHEIWQWASMGQAPLGLLIFDTYMI